MQRSLLILAVVLPILAGLLAAQFLFKPPAKAKKISIAGGEFLMGSDDGALHERPIHSRQVKSFVLDRSPVSVEEFAEWQASTGYVTEAESFGNSAVFDFERGQWLMVDGANWQFPMGPNQPQALHNHPVTHISWNDAKQYCTSLEGRLPTEAEFEYAAKGAGQYETPVYAFGDQVVKDGAYLVNIYSGEFPFRHTNEDGYIYTAPIGETGVTPLGFTDFAGNVWEWTDDWYGPYLQASPKQEKALKGGSFLCDEDVCHGYRTTGRTHSTPDSSLVHTGFRCAYNS